MQMNQLQAYNTINNGTFSGYETGGAFLTKAIVKLKDCRNNRDVDYREARLKEDNPLPKNVQLDVPRLGAFVDGRLFEITAVPEKLGVVVNINKNIASGIRGSPD